MPDETARHPDADDQPATGFPEPPGKDPGDQRGGTTPHSSLNNPVGDPDPTEWPDPYDTRPDPKAPSADPALTEQPHTPTGATSTSEPHPSKDPEAEYWEGPKKDKLDD
jgi:hypothetical protein